jgi:hypothetical protein
MTSPASEIFLQSGDRSRDGVRIIAQRGLQIASIDEFCDELFRDCPEAGQNYVIHGWVGELMRCKAIKRRSKAPQWADKRSLVRSLSFAGLAG